MRGYLVLQLCQVVITNDVAWNQHVHLLHGWMEIKSRVSNQIVMTILTGGKDDIVKSGLL